MHVAAALSRLPDVCPPPANRRARITTALNILSQGLAAVAPKLDPHQLAACLESFGRLRLAPPAAFYRVCALLCADGGGGAAAPLRRLHPWELAACAKALAALQEVEQRQRLEAVAAGAGAGEVVGGGGARGGIGIGGGAAALMLESGVLAGGGAGAERAFLFGPGVLDSTTSMVIAGDGSGEKGVARANGGSRGGGAAASALAHLTPGEALWRLLSESARPRLPNFPASDLAAISWALARSDRADKRFMTDACRAALARPGKFDADGVAAMTSAMAAAAHRDDLLLGAFCQEVVARKAEFTVPQLAGGS